jgi:hypothetical protein
LSCGPAGSWDKNVESAELIEGVRLYKEYQDAQSHDLTVPSKGTIVIVDDQVGVVPRVPSDTITTRTQTDSE